MYFSKKLKKFNTINHCFFSKKNGVSKGIYSSLNCGLGSKDKIQDIKKNIKIVCKFMGCQENKLITLRQRHTNKVIYLLSVYSFFIITFICLRLQKKDQVYIV